MAFVQKGLQYLELEANLNESSGGNNGGSLGKETIRTSKTTNEEDDIDANFSVLDGERFALKPVDALKALQMRREMSAEERNRAIEEEETALKRKLERKKAAMAVKTIDGTFAATEERTAVWTT